MVEKSQVLVWVRQAADGDVLAASKLLANYHPVLRQHSEGRMGRALKARLEPEDILQQVYTEVFRNLERFEAREPTSFLNWVLTILDHKLIDAQRALHRQMRDVAREVPLGAAGGSDSYWNLFDQLYADSPTPSRVIRREEAVGALMTCLLRLADSHRQVLQLRFLEERPVEEVASRLDKSPGAVVALTKRALEALRASMENLGEFTRG